MHFSSISSFTPYSPEMIDILRLWLPRTKSEGLSVGSSTTSNPESESGGDSLAATEGWWWFCPPFVTLYVWYWLGWYENCCWWWCRWPVLPPWLGAFSGGGNGGGCGGLPTKGARSHTQQQSSVTVHSEVIILRGQWWSKWTLHYNRMHIGREGVEDKTKKTRRWRAVMVRWERSEVEENERDFTLHTKLQQWKKNRKYCGKKVMAWF